MSIFDELNSLREQATQGEWKKKRHGSEHISVLEERYNGAARVSCMFENHENNANYILALHEAFDELKRRDAATQQLIETLEKQDCPCCVKCYSNGFVEVRDALLAEYREAIKK